MKRKLVLGMFMVVLGIVSCLFGQDGATTGDKQPNVAGTWHLSWQGRRGDREGTLEIQQDGSKLRGTFDMEGSPTPVSGNIQGNKVSLTATGGKKKKSLSFNGTVDGNKMSGTTQQGSEWSASRQ